MARFRARLTDRLELLQRAERRKWNKFTWSGLLIGVVGLLLIGIGLSFNTGAYSPEGLMIGLGAIIVMIGIIRVLIGFINPLSPTDLPPIPVAYTETVVYEQPKSTTSTSISEDDVEAVYLASKPIIE